MYERLLFSVDEDQKSTSLVNLGIIMSNEDVRRILNSARLKNISFFNLINISASSNLEIYCISDYNICFAIQYVNIWSSPELWKITIVCTGQILVCRNCVLERQIVLQHTFIVSYFFLQLKFSSMTCFFNDNLEITFSCIKVF